MTRIIAGSARGRSLHVPPAGTRPTSDRVKESLFSLLEHATGGLDGLSVVDLYAGSGALGLEAASRGASHVTLVEKATAAVRIIKSNIEATRLQGLVITASDALTWANTATAVSGGWNVVLADPPYETSDADLVAILTVLQTRGCLAPECDVILERAKPRGTAPQFPWPAGFTEQSVRTYGDTVLHHAVCYVQDVAPPQDAHVG